MKHETQYDLPDTTWEPDKQPSLEAQVVNIADEIAYNAHDLDDGIRSGHLTPEQISRVPLVGKLMNELNLSPASFGNQERFVLIRELLGLVIEDTLKHTDSCLKAMNIGTVSDVHSADHKIVATSPVMHGQLKELKDFLYENFYFHYRLIRMTKKADNILERIFNAYMKSPDMLPTNVKRAADKRGLMRAVTDYLASMTDRFASDEYKRLFDPHALT